MVCGIICVGVSPQPKESETMHIKISKSSLAEALNNAATVVSAKTSLSVLQNVKVSVRDGNATFVCSDLDTTLIAKAACTELESGETTIPIKTFAAAVSKVVDGEVDLVVDAKDVAKLTAGTSKFSFKGISAKEFPTLNNPTGKPMTLQASAIREMLRKTSFAMCTDDSRMALNSVLLDFSGGKEKVVAVATDGRRMALLNCGIDSSEEFGGTFILPRKAVDVLLKKMPKEGDCQIISSGNQLRFVTTNFEVSTKLIDQQYPNYMNVIPKEVKDKVVVDRLELLGALDRVSIFTMTDTPKVILSFGDGKLCLNSGETDYGESSDEVIIKYEGEPYKMTFNPQYIRDALNAMDDDEVEIDIIKEGAPIVIHRAKADDFTYVVMPLRIS